MSYSLKASAWRPMPNGAFAWLLQQKCRRSTAWLMTGRDETTRQVLYGGIAVAGIVWGAGPIARGQTATQQPYSAPTLKVSVNRALIPVVVRDKAGQIMENLKQQDFQVLDDGKPRPIVGFMAETSRLAMQSSPATSNNAKSQAASPAAAPREQSGSGENASHGFIVLMFDDKHSSLEYLIWAKEAAAKLLSGPMLDTNYAAIFSPSGSVHTGLTRDRGELVRALKGLQPSAILRPAGACEAMDYYEAYEYEANDPTVVSEMNEACHKSPGEAQASAHLLLLEGRVDVDTSLNQVEHIARAMAHLPGRRLLVLASPGFFAGEPNDVYRESQLIDTANAAGVTISTLNTRGLSSVDPRDYPGQAGPISPATLQAEMTVDEDVMSNLAYGTGGTFFHNSNDIGGEFEKLTDTPNTVYVLEISLDGVRQDGSFHTLQVKVDRDGSQVQARRGYNAPDAKRKQGKAN